MSASFDRQQPFLDQENMQQQYYIQPQHSFPQEQQPQNFIQPFQHASQQDVTDLIVSTSRMLHGFVTTTNARLDNVEMNVAKMCEHLRAMAYSIPPAPGPSPSSSPSLNARPLHAPPKAILDDTLQASLTILYLLRCGTLTGVGHVAMVPMAMANRPEPQLVISVAIASKFLAVACANRTAYSQTRLQKMFAGMKMLPFVGSTDGVRQQFYSACCAEFGISEGTKKSTNPKTEKTRQQKFLVVPESDFYAEVRTAIATFGDRDIPFKMLYTPDETAAKPTKRKNQYTTAPFSAQCANGAMWPTSKIRTYRSFQRRKYEFIRNHTPWTTPGPWALPDDTPLHLDQDFVATIADDDHVGDADDDKVTNGSDGEEDEVAEEEVEQRPFYREKRSSSGSGAPAAKKSKPNGNESESGSGSEDEGEGDDN